MSFFVQCLLFGIFCSKMEKVVPIQSQISHKVARDSPFFLGTIGNLMKVCTKYVSNNVFYLLLAKAVSHLKFRNMNQIF